MADNLLDEVDRGILFALQRDARDTTIADIADEVGVSASTVRNRIDRMEEKGIIEGYYPKINYERAGFPLRVIFVCSAPADERSSLAEQALESPGVIDVREMLTSQRNIYIDVVATGTRDLADITESLSTLGFDIISSEISTSHYVRPWSRFEYDDDN